MPPWPPAGQFNGVFDQPLAGSDGTAQRAPVRAPMSVVWLCVACCMLCQKACRQESRPVEVRGCLISRLAGCRIDARAVASGSVNRRKSVIDQGRFESEEAEPRLCIDAMIVAGEKCCRSFVVAHGDGNHRRALCGRVVRIWVVALNAVNHVSMAYIQTSIRHALTMCSCPRIDHTSTIKPESSQLPDFTGPVTAGP